MAAFVLERPVLQHCLITSRQYDTYRMMVYPHRLTPGKIAPLNIVWAPTRPGGRVTVISHIVPTICKVAGPLKLWQEKCGMMSVARCACVDQEAAWPMVQCDRCAQWFHCKCVSVEEGDVARKDIMWFCGCKDINAAEVAIE